MQLDHVKIIAKREYATRIKSKGFWISTALLPIIMGAWIVLPGLVASRTHAGQKLVVVDETGNLGQPLLAALSGKEEGNEKLPPQAQQVAARNRFQARVIAPGPNPKKLRAELDSEVLSGKIDAWLWISPEELAKNKIEYHAASVSNLITQEVLSHDLSRVVRQKRLADAGFNIEAIQKLSHPIGLETVRISKTGSQREGGIGALVLGVGLFVILYMTLLIYGNQVMLGVLEEKSTRIVEVLASTVRPIELMSGKLAGICGIALTQLAIWIVAALAFTSPAIVAALGAMPKDVKIPSIPPLVVMHFFLFFLLGFLLYSSFYAILGAAFNDQREAQQLAGIVVVFLVAPWMVFMPVLNNPDSTVAVVASLIPVFTPLIMMLRIAIKMPPVWQLALAYALMIGTCAAVLWVAARIYRVGILMYGKKPSLKEIVRWVRYS